MADFCGWRDCRSSETQAQLDARQCLSCGRHTNMDGLPVEQVVVPEHREWKVVSGEAQ